MFHFINEKHVVRKDAYPKKVRADPLTGLCNVLPVSGNFRELHNLMACISMRPTRDTNSMIYYTCGPQNGTSASFQAFIELMIGSKRFRHHDVVILDNAKIHGNGESEIFEDLLWNFPQDGEPLHVGVLYLPTRAPELNPIEMIFSVLASRL